MNENDVVEVTIEETEPTNGSMGKGLALGALIGSGLALVAITGGKKLKKMLDNRKAAKEQKDVVDVDAEVVED